MPIVPSFWWYQYNFSETSGLFRISIFLEKAKFPFSQDLATFKFPQKNLQITLWATSWTDFRLVSSYNIQIGLSFNLAPIFTPYDLYFGIILTLKQHFFFFFFVKKKLTPLYKRNHNELKNNAIWLFSFPKRKS